MTSFETPSFGISTSRPSATQPKALKSSPQPIGYASDLRREYTGKSPKTSSAVLPKQPTSPPATAPSFQAPKVEADLDFAERHAEARRIAQEAFAMTGSWVVFYRAIFGVGGVIDQLFANPEQRRHFETTDTFAELLEMLTSIRSQDDSKAGAHEPERMITVRMPRSLHEATIREAGELDLTINSYCITKLLQPAIRRFTPLDGSTHRGRRPGPQVISLERIKTASSNASTAKAVKKKAAKKKAAQKKAVKKSTALVTKMVKTAKKTAAKKTAARKVAKKKNKDV